MTTSATVTAPDARMPVWVMDYKQLAVNFPLLATRAEHKVCLRVAGGCSGMNDTDKDRMITYFAEALTGFRGMIWSGATRQVRADGSVDPMVTEVPGVVAAANPGAIALGTTPRTGTLQLAGESRLELDGDCTRPNPNLSGMLIVQDGADGRLQWDGDLDVYFTMMERLRDYARFSAVGLTAWNGGGVTEQEILRAAALGWPTLLVKGSGRKTDEVVARVEAGDPSLPAGHRIRIAHRDDPATLRALLVDNGFLPAA